MGTKTHKTAVVIIPPEEAWPPIQAIRRKHDRQVRRWMPHITLIYPFRDQREFEGIAQSFAQVCARFQPFEVSLARFRLFRHGARRCTLWLAPEPPEPIVRLQTALWQLVPDCDDVRRYAHGFTPHLSVGQARGETLARRLIAEWQTTWTPVRFTVSAVHLIWRQDPPDDVFRIGESIPLGASEQQEERRD